MGTASEPKECYSQGNSVLHNNCLMSAQGRCPIISQDISTSVLRAGGSEGIRSELFHCVLEIICSCKVLKEQNEIQICFQPFGFSRIKVLGS